MNTIRNIQVKAIVLLLIYLLSTGSFVLFHHDPAADKKAISCGIVERDANCDHKAHLSQSLEKCFLCNIRIVSPHVSPQLFAIVFSDKGYIERYIENASSCIYQAATTLSNRGPPPVSSF